MTLKVAVFGSTGSIGTQTLDIVRRSNGEAASLGAAPEYELVALSARSSFEMVTAQVNEFKPGFVVLPDADIAAEFEEWLKEHHDATSKPKVEVLVGGQGIEHACAAADVVINAVVGFAGAAVTLSALELGKRLGLANKESLIAAGPVAQKARKTPGAEIVPVDSEHCALHQCLRANESLGSSEPDRLDQVSKLVLTASGGPFRGYGQQRLDSVTVDDALKHPTWQMGPKVTIDSSTLMNKGLEVIEANELFHVGYDRIEVVVHPQSVVHSMVEYSDGATIAQLSMPDMRLCIAYALDFDRRHRHSYGAIDWSALNRLDFEMVDRSLFPCLDLAYWAGRLGGTAPAVLSAANEVAVDAFLNERVTWGEIARLVESVLEKHDVLPSPNLEDIIDADAWARRVGSESVGD